MSDKDLFQEIKKYATEISSEEDITKSFPYLCLKIYFPKLTDENIEEAVRGLGSDDESIDAFWIDDEDEVINIVQFKSSTSVKRVKENWAEKSWFSFLADVERKLADETFEKLCKNNRIRTEICSEYKKAKYSNYTTKLYLFHLGYCNEDIIKVYPHIEYYSFEDICEKYKEFQSMTSFDDPKECEITLSFPDAEKKFLKYQAKYLNSLKDTYVIILTGRDLIRLRKEHRYQLFNRNVRYFLGEDNSVNKEIIKTAKENPSIFYCYNNGITITCSECRIKGNQQNRLELIYPQIINGAQTVNSLYSAFESMVKERTKGRTMNDKQTAEWEALSHFDNIKILCRIVTSTKGEATDFAKNLTKFTNSQNDIKVFDFCANRPEQIELQKKFAQYGYFYERKRGERAYYIKNNKIPHEDLKKCLPELEFINTKIDIKNLTGIYHSYLGKPSNSDDYKIILSNCNQDEYISIFGSNRTDVTDAKVKDMILALNIYNVLDEQIKLYDKANKSWGKLVRESNNIELLSDFKKRVNEISFVGNSVKKDFSSIENFDENSFRNINTRFIKRYELISRGRHMLLATIKYMMDENTYTEQIINNNLFSNKEILKLNICSWLPIIMCDIVNNVYQEIERVEGSISIDKFYKRKEVFDKIKNTIIDLKDVRNWILQDEFPLKISTKNLIIKS